MLQSGRGDQTVSTEEGGKRDVVYRQRANPALAAQYVHIEPQILNSTVNWAAVSNWNQHLIMIGSK